MLSANVNYQSIRCEESPTAIDDVSFSIGKDKTPHTLDIWMCVDLDVLDIKFKGQTFEQYAAKWSTFTQGRRPMKLFWRSGRGQDANSTTLTANDALHGNMLHGSASTL
ncbi:hypothetical protein GPALN_007718 [Globodera pallida]|nr:hypothetical protein GPALN_007718 [Globodera pallida]